VGVGEGAFRSLAQQGQRGAEALRRGRCRSPPSRSRWAGGTSPARSRPATRPRNRNRTRSRRCRAWCDPRYAPGRPPAARRSAPLKTSAKLLVSLPTRITNGTRCDPPTSTPSTRNGSFSRRPAKWPSLPAVKNPSSLCSTTSLPPGLTRRSRTSPASSPSAASSSSAWRTRSTTVSSQKVGISPAAAPRRAAGPG